MQVTDRSEWIAERLKVAAARYDQRFAPVYDDRWGAEIDATHQMMLARLIDHLPPGSSVLDAGCGTGKYWPQLLDADLEIVGVDQSAGMLQRASAKHPQVQVVQQRLHTLDLGRRVDAIVCIDTMENVFPEHWPLVLAGFARHLVKDGWLYVTVELAEPSGYNPAELTKIRDEQRSLGVPLEYGEVLEDGGYHFYPTGSQVDQWLDEANFNVATDLDGDGYRHLLAVTSVDTEQ